MATTSKTTTTAAAAAMAAATSSNSANSSELFVMAAYLSGAVCIVLFTLALGWIIVWKCVLSKMPFVQELFDLKPSGIRDGADVAAESSSLPLSFQERVAAARRVRPCCVLVLAWWSLHLMRSDLWVSNTTCVCVPLETRVEQVQVADVAVGALLSTRSHTSAAIRTTSAGVRVCEWCEWCERTWVQ